MPRVGRTKKPKVDDSTESTVLTNFDDVVNERIQTLMLLKEKSNQEIRYAFNFGLSKILKYKNMKMRDFFAMQDVIVKDEFQAPPKTLKKMKSQSGTNKKVNGISKVLPYKKRVSLGRKSISITKLLESQKKVSHSDKSVNKTFEDTYFTPSKKLKSEVITPKVDMRKPILKSALRAPRFGEVMFSADGSPIYFASARETLHESKASARDTFKDKLTPRVTRSLSRSKRTLSELRK